MFYRKNNGPLDSVYLASFLLYLTLSAIKMRAYLFDGRFWAEEGMIFYAHFLHYSFFEKLFSIYNGHLELVTNFIVAVSTLVNRQYAPLVTTYFSFLFQSIPIVLLILYYKHFGLNKWTLWGFLIVFCGLPQASRVWANSINLPFYFSFLVVLIAVIPLIATYPKKTFRLLLLISGLSGIPANFLVPLFLFLAIKTKEKECYIQLMILVFTASLQIFLILTHPLDIGPREVSLNPLFYWLSILSQQLISPLLGFSLGTSLAEILKGVFRGELGPIFFAAACSMPLFFILRHAMQSTSLMLKSLFISAILLAILSILTAKGSKMILISASGGGRYFFAPNALIGLYIFITAAKNKSALLRFFICVLIFSSLIRAPHYVAGPDWLLSYKSAMQQHASHVAIWPDGWGIDLNAGREELLITPNNK